MQRLTCQILQTSRDHIKFILANCDAPLANALRRIMIAQVPTMAIHIVNVFENNSVLNDQFVCHRLGLIPLVSEQIDSYNMPWLCNCKDSFCQNCKVVFQLNVQNRQAAPLLVTSLDLKQTSRTLLRSKPVQPVKYFGIENQFQQVGIPILKLNMNQSVNMKCQAQKGIGKMHAKWSPVSVATYIPEPIVTLDEDKLSRLTLQQLQQIKQSCPRKVFNVNQHFKVIQAVNSLSCIYCNQCKKKAGEFEAGQAIKIQGSKNRFIFTVESTGAMRPASILKRAISILKNKLQQLSRSIQKQGKQMIM